MQSALRERVLYPLSVFLLITVGDLRAANAAPSLQGTTTKWVFSGVTDHFNGPAGIAIERIHNILFVCDQGKNRIVRFQITGTTLLPLASWPTPGQPAFLHPYGVAVDQATGDVFVADTGHNQIQRLRNDGVKQALWGSLGELAGEFNGPVGIAVDSKGDVYVADVSNGRVQKFDNNGKFLSQWGCGWNNRHFKTNSSLTGDGGLDGPSSIATFKATPLSDEFVLVADRSRAEVVVFTPGGDGVTVWGPSTCASCLTAPQGIAVDPSGLVVVSDRPRARLTEFKFSAGLSANSIPDPNPTVFGPGQFKGPFGVAVDSSGNIWVADDLNNSITVWH